MATVEIFGKPWRESTQEEIKAEATRLLRKGDDEAVEALRKRDEWVEELIKAAT